MKTLKWFGKCAVEMRGRVFGDEEQGTHRVQVSQRRSACRTGRQEDEGRGRISHKHGDEQEGGARPDLWPVQLR